MFLLHLALVSCSNFRVASLFRERWNIEVMHIGRDGYPTSTDYYSAKLTRDANDAVITGHIYNGNYTEELELNETRNPISGLFYRETDEFLGTLHFGTEEDESIELNFTKSFSALLAAYGQYNETHNYIVNLVNRAIIYVTLYSYELNTYDEIAITRTKPYHEPWYWTYRTPLTILICFIGSYIVLKLSGKYAKKLAHNAMNPKTDKKEKKSKKNKKQD